MNLLLVAPIFLNTRRVASQRARALALFLADRGHEVTVVTAAVPPEEVSTYPDSFKVLVSTPYDAGYSAHGKNLPPAVRALVALSVIPTEPLAVALRILKRKAIPSQIRSWAEAKFEDLNSARFSTASTVKSLLESRRWAKKAFEDLVRATNNGHFDVVISTFGPFASIWLAERVICESLADLWVADFRDPVVRSTAFPWVRVFRKAAQKKAVRQANLVTAVSEGVRDSLLHPKPYARYADKTKVLTNGYVQRQLPHQESPRPDPNVVRIAYVGQLYQGRSRPDMLFDVLREQASLNPSTRYEFHYAGGQSALAHALAEQHGVSNLLVDHGFIPHQEALQLQQDSDALLVLAWNNEGNEGVLSAKFFEYMAADKPVIALVSGNKRGSELATMVENMSLGVSAEYIDSQVGAERLGRFLQDLTEAKERGVSIHHPKRTQVETFDYRHISKKLEAMIEDIRNT